MHENIESLYHDLFIDTLRRLGRALPRGPARHEPSEGRSVDAARRRGGHDRAAPAQRDARRDRAAHVRSHEVGARTASSCARTSPGTSTSTTSGPTKAARRRTACRTIDRFMPRARRHGAAARAGGLSLLEHAVRSVRPRRRREARDVGRRFTTTCRTSRSSSGGSRIIACA